MLKVEFNLNDNVEFRPTEKGLNICAEHFITVTDGVARCQFWTFAQVFGKHFEVGTHPLIVKNTLMITT